MASSRLRATKKGRKISILLDVKDYERLLEDLDELDSIRAYDAAKRSGETPIPFDRAFQEIKRSGN